MNPSDARRFGGIERLYGEAAFQALRSAHVCVIGLGGVGSWCAEALARSGVGALTLIDGDAVAESNINRQLPALEETLGQPKALVLARRFQSINPDGKFVPVVRFVESDNLDTLIAEDALIVDAIDSLQAKAALSAWAVRNHRTIVVSGGAGGKTDPGAVTAADLSKTTGDALLSKLRTVLRKQYGFPTGASDPKKMKKFGIPAVFSTQPAAPSAVATRGSEFANFGTAMPVTAAVGLRLASETIRLITCTHPDQAKHKTDSTMDESDQRSQ